MRYLAAHLVTTALVVGLGAKSSASPSQGATATTPTGVIVGRVVDAASGTPIPSVIVGLTGPLLPRAVSVLTDSQGRFLFRSVPKGTFTLRATIGGNGYSPSGFIISGSGSQIGPYLNGGFGQRRPGGALQSIDIEDAARISDLVIKLWRGASIDGTVVDEAGEPLVNVVVAAAKRSTDGRLLTGPSTRTDDRGAYRFGTLVPGDYVVLVPQLQAAMPAATSDILAAPPDRLVSSRLANTGAAGFSGGIRVGGSAISATTGLNTSTIAPSPTGTGIDVYQTTFLPSTTSLVQASVVTVAPGEEHTGANITMQPVRAVAVSGTLTDDGGPVPQFGLRLMPLEAEDGSGMLDVASTSTDAQGRFTFPLVPAGSYRLLAQRLATTLFTDGPEAAVQATRIADRAGSWAGQEISVADRNLEGIALQLQPGRRVSGRVEFRGSGKRPSAEQLRQFAVFIGLVQPPSRMFFNPTRSGRVSADGDFVIPDCPPGRYLAYATALPGWSLLSVSVDGRPMTERAFTVDADIAELTVELTDQPAEIAGAVRTRAGGADPDASVLLFSTDRTRWRDARAATRTFRAARVSKAGAFTMAAVLPGEYFIVAAADEAVADFPDERLLTALAPLAATVRIAAGEQTAVTLTTVEASATKPPAPVQSGLGPDSIEPTAHGPFVSSEAVEDIAQAAPVARIAAGLSGVVTTDENPARPLRHAVVSITGAEIIGSRQAVTDDDGRFSFPDLPPGRYSFVAEKAGYVKTYYGSKRPGRPPGTPVALLAGQAAPTIVIRVLRGAVIAGTIRDPFGMPVASAQVTVKQPILINGQRRMVDVLNLLVPYATTDDRGRYRVYGLPPGEYTVYSAGAGPSYSGVRETNSVDVDAVLRQLKSPSGASLIPPPEPRQVSLQGGYLPGVPDAASAQFITLGAGEERSGADILTALVRSMRVQGIAVGPDGAPMQNVSVAIVNAGNNTLWGSPGLVRPGPDGRFVLPPLTPGHYLLIGRAGENGAAESASMLYSGETEFFLNDQDLSGIVLQFARGVSVSGRIVPPVGARPGDLARVRLSIRAADARGAFAPLPPAASIQENGTYRFDGVGAGAYRVTGVFPAGWSLRSAIVNGRDSLDAPLEVKAGQPVSDLILTLTDRPTELTGSLSDANGRPTSDYSMLAFSTDRSLWDVPRRISGAVRLSSDGRYRIVGLPPGEYYVTAITDFDPIQLGDPSFLEALIPASAKVTLAESERKDFNLRIGGGW